MGSGNGMKGVTQTPVSGAGRAACGSECLHRHGCYLKRMFRPWVRLCKRIPAVGLLQDSKCCVLTNESANQVPCAWSCSVAKVWITDLTHWPFLAACTYNTLCTLCGTNPALLVTSYKIAVAKHIAAKCNQLTHKMC